MALCNHVSLVPTQWEQKKPEPCEMNECACGKNASCSICGWGWGTWPCDCNKNEPLVQKDFPPHLGARNPTCFRWYGSNVADAKSIINNWRNRT